MASLTRLMPYRVLLALYTWLCGPSPCGVAGTSPSSLFTASYIRLTFDNQTTLIPILLYGVHVNLNRGSTSLTIIGTPQIHKEDKEGGGELDDEWLECDGKDGRLGREQINQDQNEISGFFSRKSC